MSVNTTKEPVPLALPAVVQCGWGPSELWRFTSGAPTLNRSLVLAHVPANMLTRLKMSFIEEPFEILHCFASPSRDLSMDSIYDDISISVVTENENGDDSKNQPEATAFKVSYNVGNYRQFCVARTAKEVYQTLKITAHVFPELAIPTVENESDVDIVVTDVFCQCVAVNAQLFGHFLPVLFFFLEKSSVAVANFLHHATSAMASEKKALTSPQQKSSWFSWKKKPIPGDEDVLAADEKFLFEESKADASFREPPTQESAKSAFSKNSNESPPTPETTWSMFQRAKSAYLDSMQLQVGIKRVTQALADTEAAFNDVVDFLQDDYFVEDVFVALPGWLKEREHSESRESSPRSSSVSSMRDGDSESGHSAADWKVIVAAHSVDSDFVVPSGLPNTVVNDLAPALRSIQSLRLANVSYFLDMLSCPPRYAVLYNQAVVDLLRRIPQLSRCMVRLPPEGARHMAGQVARIKQTCASQVRFAREKEKQA